MSKSDIILTKAIVEMGRGITCLSALLLVSCASNQEVKELPPVGTIQQVAPTQSVSQERNFQPGDSLELLVEEDSSFNGRFEVRPEGYVLIPKLGRVPVQGLTRAGAESRLKEALQKSQLTVATVFVEIRKLTVSGQDAQAVAGSPAQPKITIFLTGKVNKTGQHLVPVTDGRNPGLYEALLMTGGATNFGNLSKVKVMRMDASGRRVSQTVDVNKIQSGQQPDVPVGNGDIINVPEKVLGF